MSFQDKTPRLSTRLQSLSQVGHGGVDGAELTRHLVSTEGVVDLSANMNPYGPPPSVLQVAAQVQPGNPIAGRSALLREAIANELRLMPDSIVAGNGSVELIYGLAQVYLDPGDRVLVVGPASGEYAQASRLCGAKVVEYRARPEANFQPDLAAILALIKEHTPKLVFVSNPNNPTGQRLSESQLTALMEAAGDEGGMLVLDETYANLTDPLPEGEETNSLDLVYGGNLTIVRSLTKEFGLPGLRLGYTVAPPQVGRALQLVRPSWNVNAYAQEIGRVLMGEGSYLAVARGRLAQDKAYLLEKLAELELTPVPSAANFVLLKVGDKEGDGAECRHLLLKQQVIVRDCTCFGLTNFIRVSVGPAAATDRLMPELKKWVEAHKLRRDMPNLLTSAGRALGKTLMLQGTASQVGKSSLAAGLGRALSQEGIRVAPFKPQTMAVSGFITKEGGEIGQAQAMLAEACGVEPSANMNPILLKPESADRCQVVVRGKAQATLSAREYQKTQAEMLGIVEDSLNELRREYDLVIIEGAGSPVEINAVGLNESDFANMAVARLVKSPVLLMADAERGGVFASLVGTLELLEPDEKELVRGFIVNKFRGDPAEFGGGAEFLKKKTERPVLGVLPFIEDFKLAEGSTPEAPPVPNHEVTALDRDGIRRDLDICVVLLPNIASVDDFDALELEPGVEVRYVRELFELGSPDFVVIPGTKTSIADLQFMEDSGLGRAIQKLAERGTPVLGICGGYQMLGEFIEDPERNESRAGAVPGLGLLPVRTTYAPARPSNKVTGRVEVGRGIFQGLDGLTVTATEIQMGQTVPSPVYSFDGPSNDSGRGAGSDRSAEHVLRLTRQGGSAIDRPEGFINEQGNVWGTYLHGLFANDNFRQAVLSNLLRRKGITTSSLQARRMQTLSKDRQYDRLADLLKQNVDMRLLRELVGL